MPFTISTIRELTTKYTLVAPIPDLYDLFESLDMDTIIHATCGEYIKTRYRDLPLYTITQSENQVHVLMDELKAIFILGGRIEVDVGKTHLQADNVIRQLQSTSPLLSSMSLTVEPIETCYECAIPYSLFDKYLVAHFVATSAWATWLHPDELYTCGSGKQVLKYRYKTVKVVLERIDATIAIKYYSKTPIDELPLLIRDMLSEYDQNRLAIDSYYRSLGVQTLFYKQLPTRPKPKLQAKKWPRLCQKPRQPTITNNPLDDNTLEFQGQVYTCVNPEYPYIGKRINTSDDKEEVPFVPCCFKRPQNNKQPKSTQTSSYTIQTGKLLKAGTSGTLPEPLYNVLPTNLIRVAPTSGSGTPLDCISHALGKPLTTSLLPCIANDNKCCIISIVQDDEDDYKIQTLYEGVLYGSVIIIYGHKGTEFRGSSSIQYECIGRRVGVSTTPSFVFSIVEPWVTRLVRAFSKCMEFQTIQFKHIMSPRGFFWMAGLLRSTDDDNMIQYIDDDNRVRALNIPSLNLTVFTSPLPLMPSCAISPLSSLQTIYTTLPSALKQWTGLSVNIWSHGQHATNHGVVLVTRMDKPKSRIQLPKTLDSAVPLVIMSSIQLFPPTQSTFQYPIFKQATKYHNYSIKHYYRYYGDEFKRVVMRYNKDQIESVFLRMITDFIEKQCQKVSVVVQFVQDGRLCYTDELKDSLEYILLVASYSVHAGSLTGNKFLYMDTGDFSPVVYSGLDDYITLNMKRVYTIEDIPRNITYSFLVRIENKIVLGRVASTIKQATEYYREWFGADAEPEADKSMIKVQDRFVVLFLR